MIILILINYSLVGVVLGILTGMRGLCNGLGPALFGLIFYLSHVHLKEVGSVSVAMAATGSNDIHGLGGVSPVLINGTMSPTDVSMHEVKIKN